MVSHAAMDHRAPAPPANPAIAAAPWGPTRARPRASTARAPGGRVRATTTPPRRRHRHFRWFRSCRSHPCRQGEASPHQARGASQSSRACDASTAKPSKPCRHCHGCRRPRRTDPSRRETGSARSKSPGSRAPLDRSSRGRRQGCEASRRARRALSEPPRKDYPSPAAGASLQVALTCRSARTASHSRGAATARKSLIRTNLTPGISAIDEASTSMRCAPIAGGRTTRACTMPSTRWS